MALDRGMLAKIDRRVFPELDHSDGVQAVKVPVSNAVWSTWRRYCEAIGFSMGEGVAGLISQELGTVVGDGNEGNGMFVHRVGQEDKNRKLRLDAREHELDGRQERLRSKEEQLREWERRMRTQRAQPRFPHSAPKVGRNERCPCGSGLKYKHCHGLPGR